MENFALLMHQLDELKNIQRAQNKILLAIAVLNGFICLAFIFVLTY